MARALQRGISRLKSIRPSNSMPDQSRALSPLNRGPESVFGRNFSMVGDPDLPLFISFLSSTADNLLNGVSGYKIAYVLGLIFTIKVDDKLR